MPLMIWLAIAIEGVSGSGLDLGMLLFLQLVNGFVGWYEERNAGNAIAALKENLAPKAVVKRDNQWQTVAASELVVGDRVTIQLGDIVPADCLVEKGFLDIDQSALTGESFTVMRTEGEEAWQGSVAKRGDAEAIVMKTGPNTYLGRTSTLVASVDQVGHFQKVLLSSTLLLTVMSVILTGVIFAVMLVKGAKVLNALSVCVVIIVASIPIAMQVICTTTLAIGARALAEKKAIVSRLNSIEELAGMEVLCVDKTGTLTENKLSIKQPILAADTTEIELFRLACLASKRDIGSQCAIDSCIVQTSLARLQLDLGDYEEIAFIPFDPKNKRAEATIRNVQTGEVFRCAKGAPQVILHMANMSVKERSKIKRDFEELAARGYRTIAVAATDEGGSWVLKGIIPLYDPPRKDTAKTLSKARLMGLRIKMITGDHLAIAQETGRQLSLGGNFHTMDYLRAPEFSDTRARVEAVDQADGFAEVFPEDKFEIVQTLQGAPMRVGMTGDGVNDAPALKKADVGIAVAGSTDAARAAADIVLTQPGLSVIIKAIFTSRKIFQRIKNYCIYRIACTIQLLLFFFVAMVTVNPARFACSGHSDCDKIPHYFTFPVFAIVLIAVLNDGTLISIAVDNAKVSSRPDKWNLPLLYTVSLALGLVSLLSSLVLLLLCLLHMDATNPILFLSFFHIPTFSYGQVVTILFLKVAIADFITVFAARTESFFYSHKPSATVVIAALLATGAATLASMCWIFNFDSSEAAMKSVSWQVAVLVWVYCLGWFVLQDLTKVLLYKAVSVAREHAHTAKENDTLNVCFTQNSFADMSQEETCDLDVLLD